MDYSTCVQYIALQWRLPSELVYDVLRRLAPQHLVNLARTSKSYCSLLKQTAFAEYAYTMAKQLEGYRNVFHRKFALHFQVDHDDFVTRSVEGSGIGMRVDTDNANVEHVSLVCVADAFLCSRLETALDYAQQFPEVCATFVMAQCTFFKIMQVERTDVSYMFRIEFDKAPWMADLANYRSDVAQFQRATHLRIYRSIAM